MRQEPSLQPASKLADVSTEKAGLAPQAPSAPATDAGAPAPAAAIQASAEATLADRQATATVVPVAATQRGAAAASATARPARKTEEAASPYGQIARVAEAVAADRIDVYLDPILGLSDRKARLFEVSVRLRASEGDMLDPSVIRSIASGTGLLARIDAAKLSRSARVSARLSARGTSASLYTNLASESLSDDVFLDTFEDVMAETDELPKRLVLSFSQADVRGFNDVHWEIVATMSEMGLRFALEDLADLDMDFEKLKASGFEFVKLDAPVFLDGLPAADGAIPADDLCRHLSGHGLALIVGRIEDELCLAKVLGFGVLFGQGTIFGGARAVQVDAPQPQVAAA